MRCRGCALPPVHHCCSVSAVQVRAQNHWLQNWSCDPELREWPRCLLLSTSAALWGRSTRSLSLFLTIIWRSHSDSTFTLFVGDSSMDFTCPFTKGTFIYWLWCKFTQVNLQKRERPAAGSLNTGRLHFFLSFSNCWCVFLHANLSLTFCSCKKR